MFDTIAPAATLASWATALPGLPAELADAERIDAIRALEVLKCAAEAAQAELAADLDASQRAAAAAAGVPAERRGRGIAEQVALARRESPHRGRRHLGLAKILRAELPHTRAAFRAGRLTEWRATLIARETACLSAEHRAQVDEAVAGDPDRAEAMGDAELVAACRRLAYRLDAAAFVTRRRRAEADRRVTLRPAPDTMCHLSALLPVAQGVAVYASLKTHADALVAAGDPRGRGQIMADTLVERVTGLAATGSTADGPPVVPVEVGVVVPATSLFGESEEPGHVDGYGPVPAELVRELLRAAEEAGTARLRRLFADPDTGQLVQMESRSRLFDGGLAKLIRLRDQTCRTPWCDAPIRHTDHARAHAAGGATTFGNGQGLCEACDHAKQAPGWQARPSPGRRHTVTTTTPSGHHYSSTAPQAIDPPELLSRVELYFLDRLAVA